jgi:hypothetical protein
MARVRRQRSGPKATITSMTSNFSPMPFHPTGVTMLDNVTETGRPIEVDNLGIPPLAGLCSYERAARAGLSVDRTVELLRRYNYVARRLNETATAHLPGTPEWEVKCALGLHLWIDAEHGSSLRARIAEMREPPLRLDAVPDERLQAALEELLRAEDTVELLAGIYGVVRPALVTAIGQHLEELNPLFDHPTVRLLRTVAREQEETLEWGAQALDAVTQSPDAAQRAAAFRAHLSAFLSIAGGIRGDDVNGSDAPPPEARWDGSPYEMDVEPRRDERFIDPFNGSALIDEYYLDADRSAEERTYALAYQRLREMDVPEYMAPIMFRTRNKPWEYYRDLSRQLWDEARHAMMGEVSLYRCGVPFYTYPIDISGSYTLNHGFTPLDAHITLWYVEQSLMPRKTGKRLEMQIAELTGDPFFIGLQDYDWADEVLHAQIGRRWLQDEYPSAAARAAAGREIMERWGETLARYGADLPERDWWPEFVARARSARDAA